MAMLLLCILLLLIFGGISLILSRRIRKLKNALVVSVALIGLVLAILVGLRISFGVFAYAIPMKLFITPAVGETFSFLGFWSPLLIIIGIVIGGIAYLVSKVRSVKGLERKDSQFIGGESIEAGESLPPDGGEPIAAMRVSEEKLYETIKDYKSLKGLHDRAPKGVAYFISTLGDRLSDRLWSVVHKLVLGASDSLRKTRTRILTTYLLWMSIGIVILLLVILR